MCTPKGSFKPCLIKICVINTFKLLLYIYFIERWNFSVGTFEMDFYDGFSREIPSQSDASCINGFSDNLLFDIQSGMVSSNTFVNWSTEFGSPIAKAWILEDGSLHELDVLKDGLLRSLNQEALPDTWVYMGKSLN